MDFLMTGSAMQILPGTTGSGEKKNKGFSVPLMPLQLDFPLCLCEGEHFD